MDNEQLQQLKNELRRLNGSAHYWTTAIKRWQALAGNTKKSERQRQDAASKIAFCQAKAAEAQQQLDQVKLQITTLDPQASRNRQLNTSRTMISHQKQILAKQQQTADHLKAGGQEEASAFHQALADKAKHKLHQLEQRLAGQLNTPAESDQAARQRQLEHEHLAIASAALSFDPFDEQALARSEARQADRVIDTDLEPEDGQDTPPWH